MKPKVGLIVPTYKQVVEIYVQISPTKRQLICVR